jgi:hypothetical protein
LAFCSSQSLELFESHDFKKEKATTQPRQVEIAFSVISKNPILPLPFDCPKYLTRLPTCQTTNTEAAVVVITITMVEGTHFLSPVADDHYKKTFELGLMKILLCVSSSYT